MRRFVLLIAAAGLFASAAVSDAQPRRWRAYDDYYGGGYVQPSGTTYYGGSGPYYTSSSPYYSNGTYYSSAPYYSQFYTSTAPWTSADWYKNATLTARSTTDGQSGIVQASNNEPVTQPAPQYGLRIDDVVAGGAAKKADLR